MAGKIIADKPTGSKAMNLRNRAGGSKPPSSLTKPPLTSPTKARDSGHLKPEFINITNSFSLNSNSRTSVRAQVMRDYHRRRLERLKGDESTTSSTRNVRMPLTAKEQTSKFRISRPGNQHSWVRGTPLVRKGAPIKKRDVRHNNVDNDEKFRGWNLSRAFQISRPNNRSILDSHDSRLHSTSTGWYGSEFAETTSEVEYRNVERLLSSVEVSLQLSSIYNSVAPGVLDPFSSMSLPISPRTQLLMHHYCKLFPQYHILSVPTTNCIYCLVRSDG
jgi:hypothetical protein